MKMIQCITRPSMLESVKDALNEIGVVGMTVTDVRGCGRQRGQTERYRGTEYTVSLLHKIKIETVVPDDVADRAIEVLVETTRTGEIGDGKIFVIPVERGVRIRTGETDEDAL